MSRGRRVLIGGQRRRRGLGLMQRGLKAIAELQKTPRHGETVVHKHIMAGGGGGGGGGVTDHGALTGLGDDDHSAIYQAKTLLTALGDIIYASAANTWAKVTGNITTTKKFLTQTGNGAASAAPGWNTIADGDVPATHSGSAHHTRLHPVTGISDHSAGNWKLLYTDGSGHVIELAVGADGQILRFQGAAAAPHADDDEIAIVFCIGDADSASAAVPKLGSPVINWPCTVTKVEVKLDGDETCGATSLIVDIHKVLSANKNTDGTGTTMYTTQGNRPTIADGDRYDDATLPDVTTFAAGDVPLVYVDQAGTDVTQCTVTITAKKT